MSLENKTPPLQLGEEVEAASKIFDLAELPLGVTILQLLALKFRDYIIESNLTKEFNKIQAHIKDSLVNPKLGYLIEASIFTDEFGNIVLPYGQILFPVGVGTEPIDAYAEFIRERPIKPYNPETQRMINNSFFVWAVKTGETLQVKTIPKEFRKLVIEKSIKEARTRDLLGKWMRILPNNSYETIIRAEYWSKLFIERSNQIENENLKKRIDNLSKQMKKLQAETNQLYEKFQVVQNEIKQNSIYYETLSTISSISGIVRSAIDLNAIVCEKDNSIPIGSNLNSPIDVSKSLQITEQHIKLYSDSNAVLKIGIMTKFKSIQDMDIALDALYRDGKVPIPNREVFNLPQLP